jgi:hypothetical protein
MGSKKKAIKTARNKKKFWFKASLAAAILFLSGLVTLRESEYVISKFYFVGWPIY